MPRPSWRHRERASMSPVRATAVGVPMKSILHHPAAILAALGAVSGTLGSYGLGANVGDAPALGLYMVFAGLWFGLVIGYGLWRWGDRSLRTAANRRGGDVDRLGSRGQRRAAARPALAGRHGRARRSQELRHRIRGGRHRCSVDLAGRRFDDTFTAPSVDGGSRRFDRRAVRAAAAGDQPIRLPGHSAAARGRRPWRRRSG